VTLKVYVPGTTFFFVSTDNVDVPELVTDDGVNLAVTNFGRPLTEKFTMPVKPCPATVAVYVVFPLLATVRLVGVTASEKSPATTSVTVTLWATGPLVPVIVSG